MNPSNDTGTPPTSPARTRVRNWRSAGRVLFDAGKSFFQHQSPAAGAAIAYYTLFSLAPMLMVAIAAAGLVFGEDAARGELFGHIEGLIGANGAAAVQALLASVQHKGQGGWGTAIGLGLLLVGATTVFAQLQAALDNIWRETARGRLAAESMAPWWSLLRARLMAFGAILAVGFLLVVSLVLDSALTALNQFWPDLMRGWPQVMAIFSALMSTALSAALFAVLLRFLPSAHVPWRHVWFGAAVTAALFAAGRWVIGWYIGSTAVDSAFGAASSLVAVLVWVYISAQIFLFGAEITRAVAEQDAPRPV